MVRVLFDITRLLKRDPADQPTGIDRVTLAYARWLTGRGDIDLAPVANAAGRAFQVGRPVLEQRLERACAVTGKLAEHHPTWARLSQALGENASAPLRSQAGPLPSRLAAGVGVAARTVRSRLTAQPKGDVYLNVSHAGLDHPALLARFAAAGVRQVVMVHDLIPITHPEFCVAGAPERHRRRIRAVLKARPQILVNSRTTAESLTAYALAQGHPPPQPVIARLGIESAFRRPPAHLNAARPYFVAVGTIEPRKNLAFLLRLWEALDASLGDTAPRLVLVGRRGWEKRAVLEALDTSPAARRLVLEAGDLPDPALASLLAGARALLAPSLVEGFDLPSIEALSLGVRVIASDIEAHRELAKGALLLGAGDAEAWLAALAAATEARTEAPAFAPPTWRAHFDIVGDLMGLGRRWDQAGGE